MTDQKFLEVLHQAEIDNEKFKAEIAVLAERERCAKIAESHPIQHGEEFQDWRDSMVSAIRSGK